VYRKVVEESELNIVPRIVQLTMLCYQVHCHDGGASFSQSEFQLSFFMHHEMTNKM
jgi:hypothetical protein